MGRPSRKYPTPGSRQRGDATQIYWKNERGFFSVTFHGTGEDAEQARLQVALAMRTGEWPEWCADARAVKRWAGSEPDPTRSGDPLPAYEQHVNEEFSPGWACTSLGHIGELKAVVEKPFSEVTPADAQKFLDRILRTPGPNHPGGKPRSRATRNRALAACSRFYRWGVRLGYFETNPFEDISTLRERPTSDIDYLTKPERNLLLEEADAIGWEGLSIWIACYSGLRRSEIWRLRWDEVHLDTGVIRTTGKTGERTVPIPTALIEKLGQVPPEDRSGRVVPWPAERAKWDYQAHRILAELRERCPTIDDACIRWNAFRHTFASLLIQAGVSLTKVSGWLGNSLAICRRHYARFVPKDRRDSDIDLLE